MKWAALILWLVTAGGGFFMLGLWLRHGGMAQQTEPGQRIRPPLIFSHFGLAAAGLVVWIVYLGTGTHALRWIAFAALVPVALLGFAMLAIWLQRRQAVAATLGVSAGSASRVPAEQSFPVPVVLAHGALAVATLILVVLTAAGV